MEVWYVLITIGIVAFIIEIYTAGFIAGSIGIGFFFAAFGNYLGLEVKWQIMLFSLGVILTYFLIRPIIQKIGFRNQTTTNQEALIDRIGKVTQEINLEMNTGRVSIDGDDWKAISVNNEVIKAGTNVKVERLKSIILIVKPLK